MGISVSLSSRRAAEINPSLFARHPTDLQEEIEDYKRETIRLSRVYDLHRKLGETLDLDSMLEAFSRWLSPRINHDLVAYRHSGRGRIPTACSCHGPHRQTLLDVAMRLLENPEDIEACDRVERLGLVFQRWSLDEEGNECLLLIHQEDASRRFGDWEEVESILDDLRGPLERALVYEDLYEQARKDALTGLVNRRVFMERAEQERVQADRYGCPLVLACLDLDYFKEINDTLGHGEGDDVLRKVSRAFSSMIRDADLLARTGGDEFALILPNTSLANARGLMARICEAVRALKIGVPGSTMLGVSIGLAQWEKGDSLATWWEKADAALYRAKSGGRSQVAI
ncbi:MAG: GGDEF domain-containing protein [Magnetococcales bacterium]|nr:GGDEF domain-containing protein [Magnetococcales bacterium]MBF0151300.1 GGDEF domain-containing protein [Magnetococcales bacterium]MBF0172030.1 GGDEF domain-containing protein [Magnetococcales bacterium]MBF0346144.1 GGDEF domain-containing protein [Magnetococcales bacterium]MBF0630364.1 GGDEF domain-containing protein [Magnetococcales bacterium]